MTANFHDTELITGLQRADRRAFNHLFQQYYASLVYFAKSLSIADDEAEDIAIETFNKFWQLRENFHTLQNIKAFLYITTRNASFNVLRRRQIDARYQSEMLHAPIQNEPDIERKIIHAEILQSISNAMEQLPRKYREVFQLYFVEELKNEEIAQRLNLSLTNVSSIKHRAIQLLRKQLVSVNRVLLVVLLMKH